MLDTFYQKENLEVYKRYLYFQLKDDPRFQTEFNENEYHITYHNRIASIYFHDIGMIEEKIISDDKQIFYLHFPLTTFPIALELYQCMINKLIEEKVEPMKVVLCCSGGMTSGFFKEKMQNYNLKNNLPLIIEGAAVHTVEKKCLYYDLVLLAPQMRYKKDSIASLTHKHVDVIDPQVFATYDCGALYKQIQTYYRRVKNE